MKNKIEIQNQLLDQIVTFIPKLLLNIAFKPFSSLCHTFLLVCLFIVYLSDTVLFTNTQPLWAYKVEKLTFIVVLRRQNR